MNGKPLIYLDNAATTQKPKSVIEAVCQYYTHENANIHRGVYALAQQTTQNYEHVRQQVCEFVGASKESEIIFTSSTTAGINFLANSLLQQRLQPGDVILTTQLEHHSNLVPWQELAKKTGATLQFLPLDNQYRVDIHQLEKMSFDGTVKAIVIQHVSNVLGVEQPIQLLAKWIHNQEGIIIVDGAQAVAHIPLDMQALGVDAYCWSGHKMYGPTGVGVVYLAKKHHQDCQPFFYGGEMIHHVQDTVSTYKTAPWKFEGGTPPIAQVIGLGAAVDFINQVPLSVRVQHIENLGKQLAKQLAEIEGITVYGQGHHGIVSFNFDGIHPHDAATGYDSEGIAVRAGHHCAQPLMRLLGVNATIRASVAIYNTVEDIERFVMVTNQIKEFFDGFK